MNQDERRLFLIEYLLKEDIRLCKVQIPKDMHGQRDLLRSLMNVRMPRPIDDEFLVVQDEYLQQRSIERGITDVSDLQPITSDERLFIWQGDITTLKWYASVYAQQCEAREWKVTILSPEEIPASFDN